MRYTGEKPVDPLILTVFPPKMDGRRRIASTKMRAILPPTSTAKKPWTTIRAASSVSGAAYSPLLFHLSKVATAECARLEPMNSGCPERGRPRRSA